MPGPRPRKSTSRRRDGELDELDQEIMRTLQQDGRKSNVDIARALYVTETTVRNRIKRLINEGLMNVVAVPTPKAVGMTLSAIIGISVQLEHLHKVADELVTYPEIRYVGMSTGRYDIIIEAFFVDQEHVLNFVSHRLGALAGVSGVETSLILKVPKFSYEWEVGPAVRQAHETDSVDRGGRTRPVKE